MLSVVFSNDVSELDPKKWPSHTELKKLVSIFKNIKVRDILCWTQGTIVQGYDLSLGAAVLICEFTGGEEEELSVGASQGSILTTAKTEWE